MAEYFKTTSVSLDSGYLTAPIWKGLETRKILGVVARQGD